jgi:hypothetical protein
VAEENAMTALDQVQWHAHQSLEHMRQAIHFLEGTSDHIALWELMKSAEHRAEDIVAEVDKLAAGAAQPKDK